MDTRVPRDGDIPQSEGLHASLAKIDVERIETLEQISDPYVLLRRLESAKRWDCSTRAGGIAMAMRLYSKFIALAASWPAADVDALLHTARSIFLVNVRTMRRDLKGAAQLERMVRS